MAVKDIIEQARKNLQEPVTQKKWTEFPAYKIARERDMAAQDLPIHRCAAKAGPLIASGATVHQKFTCAKCGSRQMTDEPNVFYTSGTCEACGHTTEIKKCGFLMHLVSIRTIGQPEG